MKPHGMWKKKNIFLCLTLLLTLIICMAPDYHYFQVKSKRHSVKIALIDLATREHQFYLHHYFYAQSLSELGIKSPFFSEDNRYKLSIEPQLENHHDFVIKAVAQKDSWINDSLCEVMTLHHDGSWCAQGQCDSECWKD